MMEKVYEAKYHFLMDLRDYIRRGELKELIKDLEVYFPEQYEEFMQIYNREEKSKQIPALLRSLEGGQ